MVVYSVQGRTAVNVEPATLKRLSEIDNIVGVKEASGNISQMASVVQTVPVPKAPAITSIDPEQVHQMAVDLAALVRTVDQLAASQDQMVHQIETLQTSNQEILTSNQEILEKIPAPPPPPDVAPSRKSTTRTPPASR